MLECHRSCHSICDKPIVGLVSRTAFSVRGPKRTIRANGQLLLQPPDSIAMGPSLEEYQVIKSHQHKRGWARDTVCGVRPRYQYPTSRAVGLIRRLSTQRHGTTAWGVPAEPGSFNPFFTTLR